MKYKLLFLSAILLLIIESGCLKHTDPVTPLIPSGTFSGKFTMLHRKTDNVPYDTVKANLVITLQTPAYTYAVTGDTSKHAGSYGTFGINSNYIKFTDKTYPATGIPAKMHLAGVYGYIYDGSVFQIYAASSDTLGVLYDLKKN